MGGFISIEKERYLLKKYEGYFEIIPWQYHGNQEDIYKRAHIDAFLRGGSVFNIDPQLETGLKHELREAVSVFIKYSKIVHEREWETDGLLIGYDDKTEAELWRDYNGNNPENKEFKFDDSFMDDNPTVLYDAKGFEAVVAYSKHHVYVENKGPNARIREKKVGHGFLSIKCIVI